MSDDRRDVRATSNLLWTTVGLVLLAINLRPAIGSVSPLLHDIQRELGLSGAATSVLTTLPVACLGLFAAAGPALARRMGVSITLVLALTVMALGMLIRAMPSALPLFLGTLLAGAGLAVGNVLIPAVVKGNFPDRVRLYTGISTALLSGGAALSSGITVPVRDGLDTGWSATLALWAIPAVLALVIWGIIAARTGRPQRAAAGTSVTGALLRDATAWQATLYLALRALPFFTALGWLPTVLISDGYSRVQAGGLLSLTMLVSIPSALAAPVLAGRIGQRMMIGLIVACGALGNLGLVVAPAATTLWVVVLGVALGGGFSMAMAFIALRSPDQGTAVQLSGMVQTIGYLVGAVAGPLAFGLLGDVTNGWSVPLLVLVALTGVELVVGLLISRDRQVLQPRTTKRPVDAVTESAVPAPTAAAGGRH